MSERGPSRAALAASFAAMGAFALASQTALFREYLVVYGGNELGAGFFFSSWLLWVGAGALLALVLLRRAGGWVHRYPLLLALYPPALLAQLLLIRSLRGLAGVEPTDLFPTADLFLATFLTNAPVSLVTGFLFPIAAAAGRGASRVYVLECLGAFCGGAGFTLLLIAGGDGLTALVLVTIVLAGSGLLLGRRHRAAGAAHGSLLLVALILLVTPAGPALQSALDRMQWRSLYPAAEHVARRDTPYRRLDVGRVGEQTIAVANGALLAAWPSGDGALADAALLAPQARQHRRALLLGPALEPLRRALTAYGYREITICEPDVDGREFLGRHLPVAEGTRLVGDPLRDLREVRKPFDLVVVDVGDPDTAPAARYFTADFYRWALERMAEGGTFATAVSSAENYAGTEIANYGASVLATLASVFGEASATPGERAWFLAGRHTLDPEVLESRLALLPGEGRFEPARIHSLLEPRRVEFVREVYGGRSAAERADLVSTSDRPVTYLLNLLVLGKKEGSGFSTAVRAIRRTGPWFLLLPLLVVLLLRGRHVLARPESGPRFGAGYLLVVAGGAALALDLVLLLAFQQRHGMLFLQVGLANALFMLGMTVGGGIAAARPPGNRPALTAALSVLPAATLALLLPLLLEVVSGPGVLRLLFLVAGACCGAPFPLAVRLLARAGDSEGSAGGLLEAADHFGGAIGAAAAGVLLVPLFGGSATAWLVGLAVLTAPLLFAVEALARGPLARLVPGGRLKRLRAKRTTFGSLGASLVVVGVIASAALLAIPVRRQLDRPRLELTADELRQAAVADRYVEVSAPFLHFDAWNAGDSEPLARTLASRAVVEDVTGFGGPLNLLVSLDRAGTLRAVRLLESKETPAYIREVPEFLARFTGRDAAGEFRLVDSEEEVEGPSDLVNITGATVTCRAAVETVNRAKDRVLGDLMGREVPERAGPPPLDWGRASIAFLVLAVLGVGIHLRGGSRLRLAFLAAVLVVLGVVENLQLSMERVVNLLVFELPPVGNLPVWLLTAGVLVLSHAFGQVYCGMLCPFGAAQELLGKLGLRQRVSPAVDRRARFVKHLVLAATAVAVLLLGWRRVLDYDPLAVAFSFDAEPLLWLLIGAVLFLSVFYFRFWCRYLCPVGAMLSIFNRVAFLKRLARRKDYARCDLGVHGETDLDCIQCNRCLRPGPGKEAPA